MSLQNLPFDIKCVIACQLVESVHEELLPIVRRMNYGHGPSIYIGGITWLVWREVRSLKWLDPEMHATALAVVNSRSKFLDNRLGSWISSRAIFRALKNSLRPEAANRDNHQFWLQARARARDEGLTKSPQSWQFRRRL